MPEQNTPIHWTFDDLYNLLMYDIEQDLLTENLPTLEEKYKGETEEQQKERARRYARALSEYLKRFEKIMSAWKGRMDDIKKELRNLYEAKEQAEGKEILAELDTLIDSQ